MRTNSIVLAVAAMAVCAAVHAQTFSQKTYAGSYAYNHADLNNDGREDLIYHTQTGFAVVLSTGPGTYAAPVSYNVPDTFPAATITLDLNNDGNLDVIAFNSFDDSFHEYLNTGRGGLMFSNSFKVSAAVMDMVVGDFNHDGYPDIAFTTADGNLNVWFNHFGVGFTAGPTTSAPGIMQLSVGDFDGDGAADIAATSDQGTYLYFGDNTGHFATVNATTEHGPYYYLMDINGDGKSDLVGAAVAGAVGMYDLYYRDLWVVYGNSFRNIIQQDIPLNGYAVPWTWGDVPEKSPSVDAADFNGDGFRDFAIVEAQNQDGTGAHTLAVKMGELNGWSDEVNVYSNSDLDFGVAAIRDSDALKPGLLVDTFANNTQTAQFFLNDSTGGYFRGREYQDSPLGIDG